LNFLFKKLDIYSIRCQSNILPPDYAILLVGSGAHLIYCTWFYHNFFGWIGCQPKIPALVVYYFFGCIANPIYCTQFYATFFSWIGSQPNILAPVLCYFFFGWIGCQPKIPALVVCYFFGCIGCQPNIPNFYGRLGFIGTGAGTQFLRSVGFYWDGCGYPIFADFTGIGAGTLFR